MGTPRRAIARLRAGLVLRPSELPVAALLLALPVAALEHAPQTSADLLVAVLPPAILLLAALPSATLTAAVLPGAVQADASVTPLIAADPRRAVRGRVPPVRLERRELKG